MPKALSSYGDTATEGLSTARDAATRNWIGGDWVAAAGSYEKRDPFRPSRVTGVHAASSAEDARAAVAAARDAHPGWAGTRGPERAAFLFRAAAAVEARAERIALDMTAEMGKPIREARGEAARVAAILRFAAGEATRPVGEQYEASVANQRLWTVRRPVGVVGLIAPWNFPAAIPAWKAAPALVHGNTVVLKLAYEAPRTGLHLAECFAEAGVPPGVLNVLTGAG
jgi:aldehyde dehydrogenase (NAD+)